MSPTQFPKKEGAPPPTTRYQAFRANFSENALTSLNLDRAYDLIYWNRYRWNPSQYIVDRHPWKRSDLILANVETGLWWLLLADHDLAHLFNKQRRKLQFAKQAIKSRSYRHWAENVGDPEYPVWIPFYLISRNLRPTGAHLKNLIYDESRRSISVTVIALKRFHLARGHYPDSLSEQVPRFEESVPVDWFDGAPLRYRRTDSSDFLLWSIGEDGIDNGGDPVSAGHYSSIWDMGHDWVWPRPTPPCEVHLSLSRQHENWENYLSHRNR